MGDKYIGFALGVKGLTVISILKNVQLLLYGSTLKMIFFSRMY